jgi:HSP20 family protein
MYWSYFPSLALEQMERNVRSLLGDWSLGERSCSFPLVNLAEDEGQYTLTAEMPGMKKEQVKVTLAEGVLTLAGDRAPAVDAEKMNLIREERSCGKFEKTVRLPVKVDENKISATFENGILTVALPKV